MVRTVLIAVTAATMGLAQFGLDSDAFAQQTIIDTHAHILPPGEERGLNPNVDGTPDELRRQMADAGVTKAGIFAMVQKGQPEVMRAYNDYILEQAEAEDFFSVVSVHPSDGEVALQEVRRVAAKGATAIKLHPFFQGFDPAGPSVNAIVSLAGELDMPVIFDSISASDGGVTGKFVDMAIANPDTKIVLAHMAGYRFHEMILFAVFAKGPFYNNNVYFDLSAIAPLYANSLTANSPRSDELIWTIRQIGIEQFTFGSDFPIFDLKSSRTALEAYGFTESELSKIFSENAVEIFGLDD